MMGLATLIATARAEGATGYDLLCDVNAERGVSEAPLTTGQIALADWLIDHEGTGLLRLGETLLLRILTGETQPAERIAELIAVVTEGAVLPAMFDAHAQALARRRIVRDSVCCGEDVHLTRRGDAFAVVGARGTVTLDLVAAAALASNLSRMIGSDAR